MPSLALRDATACKNKGISVPGSFEGQLYVIVAAMVSVGVVKTGIGGFPPPALGHFAMFRLGCRLRPDLVSLGRAHRWSSRARGSGASTKEIVLHWFHSTHHVESMARENHG